MPLYEYKCGNGHIVQDFKPRDGSDALVGAPCLDEGFNVPACPSTLKRVYTLQIAPVMQEHFNPTVGKPISNMRQFDDALKQAAETQYNKLGIEANYQPCTPSEAALPAPGAPAAPQQLSLDI